MSENSPFRGSTCSRPSEADVSKGLASQNCWIQNVTPINDIGLGELRTNLVEVRRTELFPLGENHQDYGISARYVTIRMNRNVLGQLRALGMHGRVVSLNKCPFGSKTSGDLHGGRVA